MSTMKIAMPARPAIIPVIRDYITHDLLQRGDMPLEEDVALIDEGYLTSLQAVELVLFLEERFGVQISPEDVSEENFATLSSIAHLVNGKLE